MAWFPRLLERKNIQIPGSGRRWHSRSPALRWAMGDVVESQRNGARAFKGPSAFKNWPSQIVLYDSHFYDKHIFLWSHWLFMINRSLLDLLQDLQSGSSMAKPHRGLAVQILHSGHQNWASLNPVVDHYRPYQNHHRIDGGSIKSSNTPK